MDKEKIEQLIFEVIDEFNIQYNGRYQLTKSQDTVLFGREGILDSLGLVSFIAAIEEKFEDTFGKVMTLADARAVSQKNSPFRSVATLIDYLKEIINE